MTHTKRQAIFYGIIGGLIIFFEIASNFGAQMIAFPLVVFGALWAASEFLSASPE